MIIVSADKIIYKIMLFKEVKFMKSNELIKKVKSASSFRKIKLVGEHGHGHWHSTTTKN